MLDLRPGLPAYARASYDLEQHGQRTEAAALMQRALDSATEPADVAFCHQHLASLAWAAGDLATATRHVSLGLAADAGTVGLWQLKAKLDTAAGDLTAALDDLAKVVARTPTVDALLDQARLLQVAGKDPGPRSASPAPRTPSSPPTAGPTTWAPPPSRSPRGTPPPRPGSRSPNGTAASSARSPTWSPGR